MSTMKRIFSWATREWCHIAQEDAAFFLLLVIFHLSVIWQLYSTTPDPSLWTTFKYIFHIIPASFECFLLTYLLHFISLPWRRLFQGIFLIFFGVAFLADTFLFFVFNTIFDEPKFDIVMAAEPQTIIEFFQTYVFVPSTMLILLLAIICFAGLSYFLKQYASNLCISCRKVFVLCFFLSFFFFCVITVRGAYAGMVGIGKVDTFSFVAEKVVGRYYIHSPLLRFYKDGAEYIKYSRQGDELLDELDCNRESIVRNESNIPYVVFVLGESLDRNKMSIYGYPLDTTPKLNVRKQNRELLRFDDTVSGATFTLEAMRQIFSFAEKGSTATWYQKGCLIDILNDAGYHTVWLSNQTPGGRLGSMDSVLSKRSNVYKFVKAGAQDSYDENLLPLLDEAITTDSQEKNFYAIHLMGSHQSYKLRYPVTFEKFTEKDETGETELRRKTKAEYDNTVLYNDTILDEIYKRFENKDAIVIYISDHGEEVCEGSDFAGHSMENSANRHMIEVPMLVWTSREFREQHPDLVQRMMESVNQPFCTDDFIHALLDIMNIRTNNSNPHKSLWNSQYEPKERIFAGGVYHRAD